SHTSYKSLSCRRFPSRSLGKTQSHLRSYPTYGIRKSQGTRPAVEFTSSVTGHARNVDTTFGGRRIWQRVRQVRQVRVVSTRVPSEVGAAPRPMSAPAQHPIRPTFWSARGLPTESRRIAVVTRDFVWGNLMW